MKFFLDSYIECPRCHGTMNVYRSRYTKPEHWRAICKECGKVKKWKTGED